MGSSAQTPVLVTLGEGSIPGRCCTHPQGSVFLPAREVVLRDHVLSAGTSPGSASKLSKNSNVLSGRPLTEAGGMVLGDPSPTGDQAKADPGSLVKGGHSPGLIVASSIAANGSPGSPKQRIKAFSPGCRKAAEQLLPNREPASCRGSYQGVVPDGGSCQDLVPDTGSYRGLVLDGGSCLTAVVQHTPQGLGLEGRCPAPQGESPSVTRTQSCPGSPLGLACPGPLPACGVHSAEQAAMTDGHDPMMKPESQPFAGPCQVVPPPETESPGPAAPQVDSPNALVIPPQGSSDALVPHQVETSDIPVVSPRMDTPHALVPPQEACPKISNASCGGPDPMEIVLAPPEGDGTSTMEPSQETVPSSRVLRDAGIPSENVLPGGSGPAEARLEGDRPSEMAVAAAKESSTPSTVLLEGSSPYSTEPLAERAACNNVLPDKGPPSEMSLRAEGSPVVPPSPGGGASSELATRQEGNTPVLKKKKSKKKKKASCTPASLHAQDGSIKDVRDLLREAAPPTLWLDMRVRLLSPSLPLPVADHIVGG